MRMNTFATFCVNIQIIRLQKGHLEHLNWMMQTSARFYEFWQHHSLKKRTKKNNSNIAEGGEGKFGKFTGWETVGLSINICLLSFQRLSMNEWVLGFKCGVVKCSGVGNANRAKYSEKHNERILLSHLHVLKFHNTNSKRLVLRWQKTRAVVARVCQNKTDDVVNGVLNERAILGIENWMEQQADISEWKHGYLRKRIKRTKAFPVCERGLEGSCEILFFSETETWAGKNHWRNEPDLFHCTWLAAGSAGSTFNMHRNQALFVTQMMVFFKVLECAVYPSIQWSPQNPL